ncbi:MAG: methyltransferase domain-containing protein [Calditrichaeota bacterium]|nr:methyltransferase domain-containing protein [Calditrichota bacterium]
MVAKTLRVVNPNKRLWKNYNDFSEARGELVVDLLSRFINLHNAKILDIGCGTGGISIALAKAGAKVTAVDPDAGKIETLKSAVGGVEIDARVGLAENLNFQSFSFDAVVLLDVLEHVLDPDIVLQKLYGLLKKNGFLYISTPNKFSPLNVAGDPHFSLPGVALLKRAHVKKVIAGILGWQSGDRRDFPQLFSLWELDALLNANGFIWQFVNRRVISYALQHPQSIWNRPWHLKTVRQFSRFNFANIFSRPMIDYAGFFNKWLNPTWFILSRRV